MLCSFRVQQIADTPSKKVQLDRRLDEQCYDWHNPLLRVLLVSPPGSRESAAPSPLIIFRSFATLRICVTVALVYMKWQEGRTTLFGIKSAAGKRRDAARLEKVASDSSGHESPKLEKSGSQSEQDVQKGSLPTL